MKLELRWRDWRLEIGDWRLEIGDWRAEIKRIEIKGQMDEKKATPGEQLFFNYYFFMKFILCKTGTSQLLP